MGIFQQLARCMVRLTGKVLQIQRGGLRGSSTSQIIREFGLAPEIVDMCGQPEIWIDLTFQSQDEPSKLRVPLNKLKDFSKKNMTKFTQKSQVLSYSRPQWKWTFVDQFLSTRKLWTTTQWSTWCEAWWLLGGVLIRSFLSPQPHRVARVARVAGDMSG